MDKHLLSLRPYYEEPHEPSDTTMIITHVSPVDSVTTTKANKRHAGEDHTGPSLSAAGMREDDLYYLPTCRQNKPQIRSVLADLAALSPLDNFPEGISKIQRNHGGEECQFGSREKFSLTNVAASWLPSAIIQYMAANVLRLVLATLAVGGKALWQINGTLAA
ncbi:uncharacterized protein PG986_000822 [Apiospora aurea]|uniref:Uncharacterized protein n=1 Tax=Apiospora aurea TaxID=335848 RepID=A0ABR1QV53_9PEZI